MLANIAVYLNQLYFSWLYFALVEEAMAVSGKEEAINLYTARNSASYTAHQQGKINSLVAEWHVRISRRKHMIEEPCLSHGSFEVRKRKRDQGLTISFKSTDQPPNSTRVP